MNGEDGVKNNIKSGSVSEKHPGSLFSSSVFLSRQEAQSGWRENGRLANGLVSCVCCRASFFSFFLFFFLLFYLGSFFLLGRPEMTLWFVLR